MRVVHPRALAIVPALALILFQPGALRPAKDGAIIGNVRDQAGAPIADAQVAVVGTAHTAHTNAAGRYELRRIPAGTYTLRSAWPRALHVRVEDEMPPAVRGGVRAVDVDLPERGTASLPFEVSGMVRGLATLGRVGAQASTRLGLLASRVTFAPADTILVTPSVSNVRRFRLLAVQHRLHTAGVRVLRQRGESRAFAGLRELPPGNGASTRSG